MWFRVALEIQLESYGPRHASVVLWYDILCAYTASLYNMLCAKFGWGQSSDFPTQSSDPSSAQQSSDCPRNPRIAPNEVRKLWMKGNPRISRVTLSSYCRQVIHRSRTYCTRKIRAKKFDRKSIVTLFNNSECVHALTVNTSVDSHGKTRDLTQNFKNEHHSLERLQTKKRLHLLYLAPR